jgi:hypothetical protein
MLDTRIAVNLTIFSGFPAYFCKYLHFPYCQQRRYIEYTSFVLLTEFLLICMVLYVFPQLIWQHNSDMDKLMYNRVVLIFFGNIVIPQFIIYRIPKFFDILPD